MIHGAPATPAGATAPWITPPRWPPPRGSRPRAGHRPVDHTSTGATGPWITDEHPCLDVGDCGTEADPNARPGGNFAELRRLKERHPQLRTLISIVIWAPGLLAARNSVVGGRP